MDYDFYNREERALCSHLFRLLHEWITPSSDTALIARFLNQSGVTVEQENLREIKIFTEVALIRDAYFHRKPDVEKFIDLLAGEIITQEELGDVRVYSELPDVLKNPSETHPGQIRRKAKDIGIELTRDENSLYGAMQGMFNAKPDLAITFSNSLIVYEAKYTQSFDDAQLKRTQNIGEVWRNLLYRDLGFESPPSTTVSTIGPAVFKPDISWEWIFGLVQLTYPSDDRTYVAMRSAVEYLSNDFKV
jgi:hypothetical protein